MTLIKVEQDFEANEIILTYNYPVVLLNTEDMQTFYPKPEICGECWLNNNEPFNCSCK